VHGEPNLGAFGWIPVLFTPAKLEAKAAAEGSAAIMRVSEHLSVDLLVNMRFAVIHGTSTCTVVPARERIERRSCVLIAHHVSLK
jgi:hypothetical protein